MTEAASAEVGGELPRCQPVEIWRQWPVSSDQWPAKARHRFVFTDHWLL